MGVPRESILSTTLFCVLKKNSLVEVVRDDMHGRFNVDDFVICYMNSVERQLYL